MYPGFAEELLKIADAKKYLELGKIIGGGALAYGAGTAAGMGAGYLANKAYNSLTGKSIPKNYLLLAAPLLGTGAGIAYAMHKAQEQKAVRDVLEDSDDARGG